MILRNINTKSTQVPWKTHCQTRTEQPGENIILTKKLGKTLILHADFYKEQIFYVNGKIDKDELHEIECSSCYNEPFYTKDKLYLGCGHREETLECRWCKNLYLNSSVEYEDAGLCSSCEWQDGYAAANPEKY